MGSNLSIFVFLDRHRFGRSRQLREFLALVRLVARLKSIGAKHASKPIMSQRPPSVPLAPDQRVYDCKACEAIEVSIRRPQLAHAVLSA
jgi:hypothetical protein